MPDVNISVTDLPSHQYLKCVSLNVSGLHSKLRLGILDQYLTNFDVISLVETNTDLPELSDTLVSQYACFSKKKSNPSSQYKYGGIHGICILVKPVFKDSFEIISDLESECILWGKIKLNDNSQFIIGAAYIPCDNSRFHFDEIFNQIENDILDLKCRYNLPICLLGDVNAHTKLVDDLIEYRDMATEITGCDLLDESNVNFCNGINPRFTSHRYNQDCSDVNKNGNHLLSMCQSLDFRIVNGRLGSDKYRGNPTCHKSGNTNSVIDYVVVSDEMLPYVYDFCVEMFDPCLSDVHSAITCTFFNGSLIPVPSGNSHNQSSGDGNDPQRNEEIVTAERQKMRFQWSPQTAAAFESEFSSIEAELDILNENLLHLSQNSSQEGVNKLCEMLNETIIKTAKKVGAYKVVKKRTPHAKPRRQSPPWFDSECAEKRKQYYKTKNALKRTGAKAMCNKKAKEYKKFQEFAKREKPL